MSLIDDAAYAYFAGGDGVDVDLRLCKRAEHLVGDAVVRPHSDADNGYLGDIVADEDAVAANLIS